jgi:AcrR family transcriptional regulator
MAAGARAQTERRPAAKQTRTPDKAPGRGKYDRSHTPDERAREQRRRIFLAAARVFSARGYANSTVDDICTEAGVSRRTFYEHFEDLRDCLVKLHERVANRAFRAVEQYCRAQEHPNDQLRAGVEGLLGMIANFPDEAKVIFREVRSAGPELEARREALLQRFASLMFEGIARAQALGVCRLPPDEIRVYALVAAMEAVGMRYVERGEHARAIEAAPALVDMVIRAFA